MAILEKRQIDSLKGLLRSVEQEKKDIEKMIFVDKKFKEYHVERFKFLQGQQDILVMVLEMIGEMDDSMLG